MPGIDWSAVGSIATAGAVLLAVWQLHRGTVQARTDFEDDLSREYRELTRAISPHIRTGRETSEQDFVEAYPALFQYLDLSNEQVFLRLNGRISKATWTNWRDGIRANLERKHFRRAWEEVKASSNSFSELRRLEASGFKDDPWMWQPTIKRLWRGLLT